MKKSDFDFYLPEELIAQTPLEKRDGSRLLVLDKESGAMEHRHFYDLPEYLRAGDCLVLNNSRVLPARLIGTRSGGGAVELVLLRDLGEGRWECLSRPGRKTKPGTELSFGGGTWQLYANPVITGSRVTGAILIFMDVTEREQREALRREFSANVSHELKTPLTSITGFAELMKEGMVPKEKMQEFSGDIYRESRRLIDLVDDIIQLSRLDEGTANFAKTPVDLYVLAGGVIESLRPVAQRQNITLSLSGQHAVIQGVEQLLQEMVYNLCDNAIKYNVPGGNVAVSVWQNGPTTTLSVVDTGIGIPYADQSRVFERFYRVDKSHSKEVGGTGLGLSIVKHAAQYHGAKIELKSDPGKGTAIAVNFTAAK